MLLSFRPHAKRPEVGILAVRDPRSGTCSEPGSGGAHSTPVIRLASHLVARRQSCTGAPSTGANGRHRKWHESSERRRSRGHVPEQRLVRSSDVRRHRASARGAPCIRPRPRRQATNAMRSRRRARRRSQRSRRRRRDASRCDARATRERSSFGAQRWSSRDSMAMPERRRGAMPVALIFRVDESRTPRDADRAGIAMESREDHRWARRTIRSRVCACVTT